MRRLVAVLLLIIGGVALFFIFYHPPMRLMPAPLLFQEEGARVFDLAPALAEGSRIEIFYATSRLPVGSRDNRVYTVAPDRRLRLGKSTLRIGDEGSTLEQLREWTTGAAKTDRPFIHLQAMREYASLLPPTAPDAAARAWLAEIDAALAQSRDKDILIYVHGANTTVERAAGQASQLRHFSGRNAVVVLFAWPTAENFLLYTRDIENAFGSAPHLADLIALLADNTDAASIELFTYSAGATVGSDALARLALDNPLAAQRLGEVYHAAPDADFRGFVDDLGLYAKQARRVTTAVNLGDSALRLAGAVNRASRAGRPDLRELTPEAAERLLAAADAGQIEILQVHPDIMPDLSASSHTFWYDDPWVSNDVLVTLLFHLAPAARGLEAGTAASGARYWTFPADYLALIPALRETLRLEIEPPSASPP